MSGDVIVRSLYLLPAALLIAASFSLPLALGDTCQGHTVSAQHDCFTVGGQYCFLFVGVPDIVVGGLCFGHSGDVSQSGPQGSSSASLLA